MPILRTLTPTPTPTPALFGLRTAQAGAIHTTASIYKLRTAALKCSPHPTVTAVFLCCSVETVETGRSIDYTAILIGRHLYPHPART